MKQFGACLALLVLGGCAADPAPVEQMRLTQQAVAQAESTAVGEDSPELQMARTKLQRAEKNMAEEDYRRARLFAEQAELDARYAEAKLVNAKARLQLDDLNKRIAAVRTELGELK